jgi:DNA replication and repair protein RecF
LFWAFIAVPMLLKRISLLNYKNFSSVDYEFNATINCFVGKNGVGKTNLLDAIYHLAFGKSYFNPLAIQNIKHDEDFFLIDGEFEINDRREQIACSLKKGHKKIMKRNGKIYDKLSDHLGLIPLVIISPADRDLITEGSEARRKFIDTVLSQLDTLYLNQLINYNKIISQRNALLKYFALNHVFDADTLNIYNEQLNHLAKDIFQKRKQFLQDFIPIFNNYYTHISDHAEEVQLVYHSDLQEQDLIQLLEENITKDRALQFTSVGVHKDDLLFEIGHFSIKKFGSQGQQKSFLIALKLAQFEFLKKQSGKKPILLFDDIFDKLDETRVLKIVEMVNNEAFGQIFISDTHATRTEDIVKSTHQSYNLFYL